MIATPGETVQYALPLGDENIPMNPYLGKKISFKFLGKIQCVSCGTMIKKSFNQGHCFRCLQTLASCDTCIVKPELCHFHEGSCREPAWGEAHCMIPHTVYLANTTAIKVGITRQHQQMTRWMDQGATQALPFATVPTRLDSGKLEVMLKNQVADKTNWRKMLQGDGEILDLKAKVQEMLSEWPEGFAGEFNTDAEVVEIKFPVLEYPTKISSFNLDKNPEVEGTLMGIKGQYLILDNGVINMRKYQGYHLEWNS